MTLRIQFDVNEMSVHWSNNLEWRTCFCDCVIGHLMDLYKIRGYVSYTEICDRFGVPCPIEWRCIVFNRTDKVFTIDYEDFGDVVQVFCTYES